MSNQWRSKIRNDQVQLHLAEEASKHTPRIKTFEVYINNVKKTSLGRGGWNFLSILPSILRSCLIIFKQCRLL